MVEMFQFNLIVLVLFLHILTVQTAMIRTEPREITLGGFNPTQDLRITCTPSSFGIEELLGLEIGKYYGSTKRAVVHILKSSGSVAMLDPTLERRIEFSGSISGSSGALELVIRDLECSDAANPYYCFSSYNNQGIKHEETTANITFRSYPEDITMTVMPNYPVYERLPTMVTFECNGNLGNRLDQNMANFWVWQWRTVDINPRTVDNIYPNTYTQWSRYTDVNNIQCDPARDRGQPMGCQYSGRCVLTHTVTESDHGKEFRCYVVSPEYAANKTIYTISPDAISGSSGLSSLSLGWISVATLVTLKSFFVG